MRPRLTAAANRLRSPDFLIALALFIFAFVIRVIGVRGWLPYVGHPDEPKLVDSAIHIVKSGDLNPHLYIWPSLYTYVEALVVRAHLTYGTIRGYYVGPQSLPDITHIFSLVPSLYLWVRTFTAVVGALTIALLYFAGKEIFDGNRRIGLVAALLVAVSPLHVEYSHFAITDVPLGLVGLLVLWASYRLAAAPYSGTRSLRSDPLFWRSALAGLLVGVATGTKYNGLYLMVVPLIAWFIAWQRARKQSRAPGAPAAPLFSRRNILSIAAIPLFAAAGFLLAEPYLILDWPSFYNGFTFQVEAYVPAQNIGEIWASFVQHFSDLATSDSHLLIPAAMGAVVMLLSPMARGRAWLLIPFPILYVLAMSRFSLVYVRNMIVTMPFLALVGAYLVDMVAVQVVTFVRNSGVTLPSMDNITRSRRIWGAVRWGVVAVAALLLVWEPLRISWAYSRSMADPDSRTLAWNWMRDRIAAGDRFAAELHPWQVQDWPDVLPFDVERPADKQQLTLRPPGWYSDHGYNYVVLNSNLTDRERDQKYMPEYARLPEAAHFKGDKEGGKGPTISILATGALTTPMLSRLGARVNDFGVLEGFDLAPLTSTQVLLDPASPLPGGSYTPGGAIGLNLYYQAERDGTPTDPGWQVWIHLVEPSTGATVAQLDAAPISGLLRNYPSVQQIFHPVSQWHRGEMVAGVYNLALPGGLAPGSYRLETGLWVPPNGPGAVFTSPTGGASDRIVLGTIEVR